MSKVWPIPWPTLKYQFWFLSIIISVSFYISNKEKKKIYFSDKYVEAKIYLDNNENKKATEILRNIILEDENTYAALSLFLILEENLINDEKELLRLFNLMLKDKKFEDEIKNLIIFKKAIYESNFVSESELLETLKPLIISGTIWKPHALLLLGDYFGYKKENLKAQQFYLQILSTKNLQKEFYDMANLRLSLISDE